jgi:hypothetical protein
VNTGPGDCTAVLPFQRASPPPLSYCFTPRTGHQGGGPFASNRPGPSSGPASVHCLVIQSQWMKAHLVTTL